MQKEPRISFQNLDHSDAIESDIRSRIIELEKFHPRMIGCSVVVDAPHRDKHKGKIYEVRIDISVPGRDIAVSREAGLNHAHEDIYVAIRDSFDAARRLLEDRIRKMSSHRTRPHPTASHGHVARILNEEGFGFIETEDGHEVYFDRDSLTKPVWAQIKIGSRLRFKERDGDKGPYGTQVTLLD